MPTETKTEQTPDGAERTARPIKSIRIRGKTVVLPDAAECIGQELGITVTLCEVNDAPAFVTGTWQGAEALRKELVRNGYQVLYGSQPDLIDHVLAIREMPPEHRRQRRLSCLD